MQPFAPNAVLWIGLSLGIGAPAAASIPPPELATCPPGGQTVGSIAPGRTVGKGADR